MNIRILVLLSLLLGIGTVLHLVMPGVLFGMKPDLQLAMMFLGILLFPRVKYVLVLAFATGILTAITTTMPGGQISNLIDKPITAFAFFGLYVLLSKVVKDVVLAPVMTAFGTMISGSVFLSVALFIVGVDLGAGFGALFATVVIPATIANTVIIFVVYPILQSIMKRSSISLQEA
ncbi:tryptophan transporter [Salinibacillus xinjiangensis]|uniref:Tryptophan transporter n=1 Tax=Salinibacillus xinjiangensis TaxID=1229268 RepID=A0A6G1X7L7_9BACI|nr:tryptophan transporter [Salinibacillus xinjiangensis]MRG86932.1 tryptophan transporter [Salinibacillus xinjiangensis]